MAAPAGVPEWPKGAGCKPAGSAFRGSNPLPCTPFVAQLAGIRSRGFPPTRRSLKPATFGAGARPGQPSRCGDPLTTAAATGQFAGPKSRATRTVEVWRVLGAARSRDGPEHGHVRCTWPWGLQLLGAVRRASQRKAHLQRPHQSSGPYVVVAHSDGVWLSGEYTVVPRSVAAKGPVDCSQFPQPGG